MLKCHEKYSKKALKFQLTLKFYSQEQVFGFFGFFFLGSALFLFVKNCTIIPAGAACYNSPV